MIAGPIKINDFETEPWIVVDKHHGKIRVLINKAKLYRVLNNKIIIQKALDMLLVDKINELLENLAKREEEAEEDIKNYGGKEDGKPIRESGPAKPDDAKSGRSGTSSSQSRFI